MVVFVMKMLEKMIGLIRWYLGDIIVFISFLTIFGAVFGAKNFWIGIFPAFGCSILIRAIFYFGEGRHRPDRFRGNGD